MSSINNENKLEQFNEFFSIDYQFSVNISGVVKNIPSFEQFIDTIPVPFKMATEVSTIDQAALRPLQNLSGVATQLVDFLNFQSQKIELLVGYILSQQDEPQHRFTGTKFGGGGIMFKSPTAFALNDILEMKVFLLHANCAVFCLGEVINIDQNDDEFTHQVIFHYIRAEDREILVRMSLHEQSKQLQNLAKKRHIEASTRAAGTNSDR
ncbi:MAG: PilZ domain-containing protein [Gammaproteobacteria bacterium]|nr:MAG: PilZ domain-containing protein [Gammaproteobacteria bacterium]